MYGTYCRLNLPVWASDREVIRAASKKLKRRFRHDRKRRDVRHEFYRNMLQYHADARELYRAVHGALI